MMKRRRSIAVRWLIIGLIGLIGNCLTSSPLLAQRPYERHNLVTGNMAPGLAAQASRIADPGLAHVVQPVRLQAPEFCQLEIGSNGGFSPALDSQVTVGLMIGPVYRFKVTNIPGNPGQELYPSIEVLGRLHTPAGLEEKFPIQINLLQDDLDKAIAGGLVTKVIYLENPETAFPHRHVEGQQPYFDVLRNEDPLLAAERLGRPMAILRIGSRIPTYQADDQNFDFNSPVPIIIGESEIVGQAANPRLR